MDLTMACNGGMRASNQCSRRQPVVGANRTSHFFLGPGNWKSDPTLARGLSAFGNWLCRTGQHATEQGMAVGGNTDRVRAGGARDAGSGRPAYGRANRSKLGQRAAFLRGARSRCGRIPRSARTVGLGDFTGARTAASLATPPDRSAGSRSVQNRAVGP
jgi:hypothetical protein